jgi:hypothetical protein
MSGRARTFPVGPFGHGPRRSVGAMVPTAPAAPDTPSTPSPADTATAYYTLLSWVSARATKFDIYLDTVNPPTTIVVPKYNTTSYVPTLTAGTTYYWKIVAFNDGGSATGPVWSFATPAATSVLVSLAGSIVSSQSIVQSLSIHDVLGSEPNSASLTIDTTPPTAGQLVRIGLGTLDDDHLLFGGEVQDVDQTYLGTPNSPIYPAVLIDHTFRLNRRRPFGSWVNVSATTIARYLVATFSTGFTSNHVQDGLPTVSIIFDGSQDFMTCMRALATAISDSANAGKTKVDYAKDVWLYLTYTGEQPNPIDTSHPPLNAPSPIRFGTDLSQIRTRVYGKGHGEAVLSDVVMGETILPIADVVMFNAGGGQAIASTTSDGAQGQLLTYAGVQVAAGGSLVGPGATPSVALTASVLSGGTELGIGTYSYAYTDVTAAGESVPSPTVAIAVVGVIPAPTNAPHFTGTSGTMPESGFFDYAYSYVSADGETTVGPRNGSHSDGTTGLVFNQINPGPTGVTARRVYRTPSCATGADADAATLQLLTTLADNVTTTFTDNSSSDAILGAAARTTNTTIARRVALASIVSGASGTTARKVYRTAVNGAQLKLLTTLADNVTTTFTDATIDSALGANAPTADTSGLTQPAGQVNAGSTAIPTASAAPFAAIGGWATLGGQTVRYTGISGNTLTGVPASGAGAILTTVLNGSQILPAPALVGINHWNGLSLAMAKGSSVNIWVQRDDTVAQAALGLLERDDAGNPTDGVREYTITDDRSTEARMVALCDADLAIFSRPIVTAQYYTRDSKTKSGRTASVSLPGFGGTAILTAVFDPLVFDQAVFLAVDSALAVYTAFTIQSVDIMVDATHANPLYHVTATSVAFTLSDLLRRVALKA